MAFAPVNPLAAPWQARGLDWLLMPEDLPPELSLCVMPDAVPAAPVRRPQAAEQAPETAAPVRSWRPLPPHVWPAVWQERL